jgi:hypothetical protein
MKKTIIVIVYVVLVIGVLSAAGVSLESAGEIGHKWLRHVYPERMAIEIARQQPVARDGVTLFYIFELKDGGWVLVAADDASEPILAYCDSGSFEYPVSSPEARYWLETYEDQLLEAARRRQSNAEKLLLWNEIRAGNFTRWESTRDVSPLLNTNWNQDTYYNAYCPLDYYGPGGHAYAGCTATAMGQVMKKWNYPPQGTISHSYLENTYGTLYANFGATTYNWAIMPPSLSGFNAAVATLLFHCGVSVDMDYGPYSSAALVYTNDAMEVFFGYDPAAQWAMRSNYSDSDWINLMKADLNAGRPIIYQGYNSSQLNGHSFVMDGFSAGNYFHFNWGWGGLYNGNFLLNSLIPITGYDFSYFQWAYYNLYPGVTISGTVTDSSSQPLAGVTLGFTNTSGSAVTDANGVYSKAVPTGYTGIAAPSLYGYAFTPPLRNYTNITTNQTAQNYTGQAGAPQPPTNLIATPISYSQINLAWTDNSSDETGFVIDYMQSGMPWANLTTVAADVTTYQHIGLPPNSMYQYRVLAYNGNGNSSYAYSNFVTTLSAPPPTNLNTSWITDTSATLSWIEAGTAVTWALEYGPPGFTPGMGQGVSYPSLTNSNIILNGLTPSTPYEWYVRSNYPPSGSSPWAGPIAFITLNPGLPYPWTENFESGLVNLVSDPSSNTPRAVTAVLASQGVQSVRNAYQANNRNILVTSSVFDLTSSSLPTLFFDQIAKLENNYDHGYVEISTDSGLSWTPLPQSAYLGAGNYVVPTQNSPEGPCFMSSSYSTWSGTTPDNSWWKNESFDLSAYQWCNTVMLRFHLKSDNSVQQYGWLIDNVRVQELPSYSFSVAVPIGVSVGRGLSHAYPVTISNTGATADMYQPAIGASGAWTYGLYEADGITPLTVPISIAPGLTYTYTIKVTTPTTGINNFDTDTQGFTVTSLATATSYPFTITTRVLFGDTIGDAIVIGSLPYTATSTTSYYYHDYGPYGPISGLVNLINPVTSYYADSTLGTSPDVVYQLTLAAPTMLSIDLLGSAYDTAVALVATPGTSAVDVLLINDDYYTAPTAYVSYVNTGCNAVPAGTYYIIIGGWSASNGNYNLSVAAAPIPVAPAVMVQINSAANTLILSWTQNPVMRYNIYSDTNPYGSFSTVVATGLNASTYTISPIPAVNTFYRVTEYFCYP